MTETDIAKLPDLAGFEKIKDWFIERDRLLKVFTNKDRKFNDAGKLIAIKEWKEWELSPPARLVIFGVSGTGKTRAMKAGLEVISDSAKWYEPKESIRHSISPKEIQVVEKECKEGRSAFDIFYNLCPGICDYAERCKFVNHHHMIRECCYNTSVLFIIDDLQEFQSKAHLEFLKEAFDEEWLSICAAVQIPEALPPGDIKPWLIEQLGQGRNQSQAEAVVRRLLEPENTFLFLKKRSTPGTTGSNRGNDTPAGKKGRGTV